MTIELSPQIAASPTSFSSAGTTITASVSLLNRPEYTGKPAISGLTTITPKIVCSRLPTGKVPFSLIFSASETTCDAGNAYSDLDYRWDFGDASGDETFTDHWNNSSVNANTSQIGPEAAYLYRDAGTYTVTLTVTGKDGNGDLVTAQTTEIVTIGTYYIWLGNKSGGTFTLTVNGETTSAIAWDATNAQILSALHALPSLDATNCKMQYQKNVVEFIGNLAGTTITFTGDFSGLTGTAGTPAIRTELASAEYSVVTAESSSGLTTQYFDSTYAGGNGASDGTITRPYTTIAQLRTFVTGGSNRKAILVDGSTWTMTANIKWDAGQSTVRIERSGGGAKPIINCATYSFTVEGTWGYSAAPTLAGGDIVFSGIDFRGSTAHAMFSMNGSNNNDQNYAYSRYTNFLFDNCDYTSSGTSSDAYAMSVVPSNLGGVYCTGIVLWNMTIAMGNAAAQALFIGHSQWLAIVGGSVSGGVGNTTLDHHIYTNLQDHCLLRWIQSGSGTKSYFLNGNVTNTAGTVRYYLVDGCYTGGVLRGFDFSNSNNDTSMSGKFDQVVLQFNRVPNSSAGLLCNNLQRITIRYCDFFNNLAGSISCADDVTPTDYSIYACRFYSGIIAIIANQTGYFHNNYIHAVSAQSSSWKVGLQFRSSSTSVETWDCDGNTWYCPNGTDTFYDRTADAYVSFATWQSWGNDANGAVTNPGFADPVNGVFVSNSTASVEWPAGFTSLEVSTDGGSVWNSYTNQSDVAVGDIDERTVVMFRATAPAQNGTFDVVVTTDGDSLDTASETDTVTITGSGLVKYLPMNYGSSVLVISYENNGA